MVYPTQARAVGKVYPAARLSDSPRRGYDSGRALGAIPDSPGLALSVAAVGPLCAIIRTAASTLHEEVRYDLDSARRSQLSARGRRR